MRNISDKKPPQTANGTAPQDVQVHVDVTAHTVTLSQRPHQFAVEPVKIVLPFDAVKAVAAQVLMIEVQQSGAVQAERAGAER